MDSAFKKHMVYITITTYIYHLGNSTGANTTQNDAVTLNLMRRAPAEKQWKSRSTPMKCAINLIYM